MANVIDDLRARIESTANSVHEAGKIAATAISLGVASVGAQAAGAVDLDTVRDALRAGTQPLRRGIEIAGNRESVGSRITTESFNSHAVKIAESELTAEQRKQLDTDREKYQRDLRHITIRPPEKSDLMKQVEARCQELIAEAKKEAETKVDQKKLSEEQANYDKELETWRRRMGTNIGLIPPASPTPGPTMQEVDRLTHQILERRATNPTPARSPAAAPAVPSESNDPGWGVISNDGPSVDPGFGVMPRQSRPVSDRARALHEEALRQAGNTFVNVPPPEWFEEVMKK